MTRCDAISESLTLVNPDCVVSTVVIEPAVTAEPEEPEFEPDEEPQVASSYLTCDLYRSPLVSFTIMSQLSNARWPVTLLTLWRLTPSPPGSIQQASALLIPISDPMGPAHISRLAERLGRIALVEVGVDQASPEAHDLLFTRRRPPEAQSPIAFTDFHRNAHGAR